MKKVTKLMLVAVLLMSGISMLKAQNEIKEFKVYGNCGMCKTRIEKAASAVEGVSFAEWDKTTKMIKVTFDAGKADLSKIQKAIAKVGHDTEMFKADDEVYSKLPKCCLYERKE